MRLRLQCITQLIYSASNKRIYAVFLLRECVLTFLILVKSKCNLQKRYTAWQTDERTINIHFLSRFDRGLCIVFSANRTIRTSTFYKNYCDLKYVAINNVRLTATTTTGIAAAAASVAMTVSVHRRKLNDDLS